MLKYDKMYKSIGTRKIAHFLNPRIINADTFNFPHNSLLYWNKPTNIIEPFSADIGFLKNEKKVYVNIKTEYSGETIGSFKSRGISDGNIVRDIKKGEKSFKYIKPGQKNISVSPSHLLTMHYGAITYTHRYSANPLSDYYKWYNSFNTIVNELQSNTYRTDRHKFLFIEIPTKLPTRLELDRFSKKINTSTLNTLITPKYLDVLELWKYLTPEYKEDSVLNKIPVNDLANIDIMFYLDNKIILINLELLYSTIKENDHTTNIKAYPAQTMRKVFYKMLYALINSSGINADDVKDGEIEKDVNVSDNITKTVESNSGDDVVNIDEVIEEGVIEKDLEVEIVDSGDEIIDEQELSAFDINDTLEDIDTSTFNTIEEVLTEEPVVEDKVHKETLFLRENKIITKKRADDIVDVLSKQKQNPSPFKDNNLTVGEMLDQTTDDFSIKDEDTIISSNKVVFVEEHNKDTLSVIKKDYIKNHYEKDLLRTVYSLQNNGVIINDYSIEERESVLGKTEQHSITINALNGRPSTVRIDLPKIEEDGTYMSSGNQYKMIYQRSDLPIRKISATRVALSSYYGKMFVDKAYAKKDDLGYWLRKKILGLYEESDDIRDLILLPADNADANVPKLYGVISRYIKSFRYKTILFSFDYGKRNTLFKDLSMKDINKIEGKDVVVVGVRGNKPIVMDFQDRVFVYEDNGFKELDDIISMLGIPKQTLPIEFSAVKMYKKSIPVVVLLSYYFGLIKLLKLLKVKYVVSNDNKRLKLEDDQFVVKFKNTKLIITRDYGENDLILGGLLNLKNIIKDLNIETMNSRDKFSAFFTKATFSVLYINEIKMVENMFVDPMTESNLRIMKEPLRFKGLLIRANELLVNDTYTNPNNINQMVIKGYERLAGMMYSELVKSMKEHENRSHFGKSKISMAPHAVINKINEDSTTILVDDINPMAALKQDEKVTYLGQQGRSKEGIGRDTREMHSSEIGIISEASPDSGDVGISAYLTATPAMSNSRGKTNDLDIKKAANNNILSTTAMLAPFSDKDDVKRTNFINIMASHIIPMDNMKVPYVRTGYEAIVPIRFSNKYVKIAQANGKVIDVTNKTITIEYEPEEKGGKSKTDKINLKKWTSKEESDATYTHIMLSNVTKGQKFEKDDTIAYDSLFFEPDIFTPARVIYKQSTNVTVALTEDPQTFEDSGAISKKMYKDLGVTVTKVKSMVVSKDDNILNMVKKGSKVTPADTLYTVTDSILNNTTMDERSISILQDMKSSSPKAKVKGVVDNIIIYYNCELGDMSDSLQELAKESNKNLKANTNNSGKVDGGYRIKGIPIRPDEVEIKIYLKVNENMGIGDKGILGNQLKFTVGEVYDYDITTKDGTDVDLVFSAKSIAARIVNSPDLMGTTGMCLERIAKNAVDIYFNA